MGNVDDGDKAAVYADADLFILPSFSENFGVVVAAALLSGLPVIATRGAPWEGLQRYQCGWWVDATVTGLSQALRDAMEKSPAQLREMGSRGRIYAQQFDSPTIALQTADVYRWILGTIERPACVILD